MRKKIGFENKEEKVTFIINVCRKKLAIEDKLDKVILGKRPRLNIMCHLKICSTLDIITI